MSCAPDEQLGFRCADDAVDRRLRGDRINMLFAGVHESPPGTNRTINDVRSSVANGGEPDMARAARFGSD
jgi:hypothetical protein